MFENTFDKQLEKTLKIGEQYTIEREKTKELFCIEYDKKTILALLELLITKGHPGEESFANQFKTHYYSDNYDDKEMAMFKKLVGRYKEDLISTLEEAIGEKE